MADRLNWSPGSRGKGFVARNGEVVTWNVDEDGAPHHLQEWQRTHEHSPMGFYFSVTPDGGVSNGGLDFQNTMSMEDPAVVRHIVQTDPRLYDDTEVEQEEEQDPRVEQDGGYGHAWDLLSHVAHEDPLDELSRWLETVAPRPSLHHDSPSDVSPEAAVSPSPAPAVLPPTETPDQRRQGAERPIYPDSDRGDPEIARPGQWGEESDATVHDPRPDNPLGIPRFYW